MLTAQTPDARSLRLDAVCAQDATAGSPAERTILLGSLLGRSRVSTAIRPLSPSQLNVLDAALARADSALEPQHCTRWVRPVVTGVAYSSGESYTDRDGPLWKGRGFTAWAAGGMAHATGPISAALRPVAFVSENRAYTPAIPAPAGIDLPSRMGSRRYARLFPGESFVRVEHWRVAAALSSEAQMWGPAHYYPLLLSTEGPGIPRASLEARDLPIGVGHFSAEWFLGALEASSVSGLTPGSRSRIASAAVASFSPAGLTGLEMGAGRFFHVRRTAGTLNWSTAALPFSGLLKSQSRDVVEGGYNQLATVFLRVAPPSSGVEVYAEMLRDDHSAELRDALGEPDHESAYTIGARRAWRRGADLWGITAERTNGRITHLVRVREQASMYVHGTISEGHTLDGQLLGSAAVLGGQGLILVLSRTGTHHSRDITYELRALGQSQEGGSLGGNNTGVHSIRLDESVARLAAVLTADLRLGYGDAPDVQFFLGMTRRF